MALRKIMNYNIDDILRKKSMNVEKIDVSILAILDDMAETMYKTNAAGLAAVQVGILKRLVVIDVGEGLIKLINPVIVGCHGEQQKYEGCMSIPGTFGMVKRPYQVDVKGFNEKGGAIRIQATGLLARVLCHEIDHLDGILFIDKAMKESIYNIYDSRNKNKFT